MGAAASTGQAEAAPIDADAVKAEVAACLRDDVQDSTVEHVREETQTVLAHLQYRAPRGNAARVSSPGGRRGRDVEISL